MLVIARPRAAAASGADLALINRRDRVGHLRRAGYSVATYVACPGPSGGVIVGLLGLPPLASATVAGRTPRRWLVAAIRRAAGRSYLTVAHRGSLTPAIVAHAVGSEPTIVQLVGGGGPRRRSTLLVSRPRQNQPFMAVKVGLIRDEARGAKEQQVLRRLGHVGAGEHVPHALGTGRVGPMCWSAESAAIGTPLADVLSSGARHEDLIPLLADLVTWFAHLGSVTRTTRVWASTDSGLALRGEHSSLRHLREKLHDVPAVFVHGDMGPGFNVLLHAGSFSIIDWETFADAELPLTDVLPVVCNALAALRGHRGAVPAAGYIIRLCAGHEPDSGWLLSQIRTYCREVRVPVDRAGALAALAWGYEASMRVVHEELVRSAGADVTPWETPADHIARHWLDHPDLGERWTALSSSGC
jgi:hypothetical protein